MSTERPPDPYRGYRFKIELESLLVAGFAEVSGLDGGIDTEDYAEGGVNHFTHKVVTHANQSTVTLRRGLTDSTELWDWVRDTIHGRIVRKQVRIILLNDQGSEGWGWELRGALPVNWSGPDFQADQGAVAMEELELSHHGVSRIEGLPPG